MPSVELNKLQAAAPPRSLSQSDRSAVQRGANSSANAPDNPAKPGVAIEIGASAGAAVDAATPPLDNDRVAEIRDALRDGRYPLVPAEIADAMIAAQLSFGIRA